MAAGSADDGKGLELAAFLGGVIYLVWLGVRGGGSLLGRQKAPKVQYQTLFRNLKVTCPLTA
ncbi:hypothetical protein LX32DRAFT_635239, partial [Colletotrichum zoysiae]